MDDHDGIIYAAAGDALIIFDRLVHMMRLDLTNADAAFFIRKEKKKA